MTPESFLPDLRPWVENLVNIWPAYIIKPQFAFWEVWHILALAILGGVTILLSLRILGAGIDNQPASVLERNLRGWLHVGAIGVIVSGILIGMANAERLYTSVAFTVKMIAMVSGLIISYLALAPIARADGKVSGGAKIAAIVALVLWLVSMLIFATTKLINPGVLHAVLAAALIVFIVTKGRARWVFTGVLAALIAAQQLATRVAIAPDDFAALDPANKAFMWTIAAWVFGFALFRIFGRSDRDGAPLAKIVAYAAVLVWVTTAAAGRWIAFA